MKELPKFYTALVNATEEALEAIERMDFGTARTLLIQGQIRAEGECVAWMEKEE